jgi:hypothetical protein
MIIFFDKLYSSIPIKQNCLDKVRFYSALRFFVRTTANIVLPLYFRLTAHNSEYSLRPTKKTDGRLIVSLTSFPARINKVWMVVETILRQTYKPDMIILWLSKEQFPTLNDLPHNLLRMQKRGLQIELRDGDLRSHKKYYYTLKEYPKDIMITVDDDVFYNTNIVEYLMKSYSKYPDSVCCNHSHIIGLSGGKIMPYRTWIHNENTNEVPAADIIPIGIGGVLYPADILCSEVLNETALKANCFMGDDIWLKVMALLNGKYTIQTQYHSIYLPIQNIHNRTLASKNIQNGNDIQIAAVRKYCIEKFGKDPFECEQIS